jgi:hypothetical protein
MAVVGYVLTELFGRREHAQASESGPWSEGLVNTTSVLLFLTLDVIVIMAALG